MKTKSIYIHPNEQRSGCRIVAMGMMSFLKSRVKKVAFFKPIISQPFDKDDDIDFFLKYFRLDQTQHSAYGVMLEDAKQLLLYGHVDELLESIIEKYKILEDEYEFILCHGLKQNIFENLDLDLNLKIANSMASSIIPVLKGKNRNKEDILNDINIFHKTLENSECDIFSVFVNRVDPKILDSLRKEVSKLSFLIFLLPESQELDKPTMADIAKQLNAVLIMGDETQLDRTVNQSKIAAMTLRNFLTYLEEGDIIIVSGDREDIYIGTLWANISKNYPSIAGILLTGGMTPAHSIMKLTKGLDVPLLPLLGIDTDTEKAAKLIRDIKPEITLESKRKISLAIGIFNACVDFKAMEKRIKASTTDYLPPVMFEYLLYEKAKKYCKNILLPESSDERILRAAEIALRRGIARITLLGNPEEIKIKCDILGIDLGNAAIVDPQNSPYMEEFVEKFYQLRKHKGIIKENAREMMTRITYFATMMVYCGYVDGIVSGATHTTRETVKSTLEMIKAKTGIKLVSSIFFMLLQSKVLVFADCAINPDPNEEELAQIAISSADTAKAFDIEPRVAMLSYSSGDSGVGKDVEKVKNATTIVKSLRPDIQIEGPIQYDAAIDLEVARIKLPESKVAGKATVFIFPDLNTGNNTYKAVQRAAKSLAIGPILQGLKTPVNDLSRGCLVGDVIYTIAITSIQAGENI
jgi:phosphate acetyltransferase